MLISLLHILSLLAPIFSVIWLVLIKGEIIKGTPFEYVMVGILILMTLILDFHFFWSSHRAKKEKKSSRRRTKRSPTAFVLGGLILGLFSSIVMVAAFYLPSPVETITITITPTPPPVRPEPESVIGDVNILNTKTESGVVFTDFNRDAPFTHDDVYITVGQTLLDADKHYISDFTMEIPLRDIGGAGICINLAIDNSGSIIEELPIVKKAARQIPEMLPEALFQVIVFDSTVRPSGYGTAQEAMTLIASLTGDGKSTSTYDAIAESQLDSPCSWDKTHTFVITDGKDTQSTTSMTEAAQSVKGSMIVIGVASSDFDQKSIKDFTQLCVENCSHISAFAYELEDLINKITIPVNTRRLTILTADLTGPVTIAIGKEDFEFTIR